MMIQYDNHSDLYKCIRCYNGGSIIITVENFLHKIGQNFKNL